MSRRVRSDLEEGAHMLEPVTAPSDTEDAVADHDHAWRRTPRGPGRPTLLGEYLCDLCPATWSM